MRRTTTALLLLVALSAASPAAAIESPLTANLDGSQVAPSTGSLATGIATLTYDDDPMSTFLTLNIVVIGGIEILDFASARAFHIHVADVGDPGGVILSVGSTSDWVMIDPMAGGGIGLTYSLDLSSEMVGTADGLNPFGQFNTECPSFQPCLDFFEAALLSEGTYLQLHTTSFMGGEIRGQIVPEPGAPATAAAALLTLTALARVRRGGARR